MLAIILTVLGMCMTPPPRIPAPRPVETAIVETVAESENDGIRLKKEGEKRAYGNEGSQTDPRDIEEGRNPATYPMPRSENERNYTVTPEENKPEILPETRDNLVESENRNDAGGDVKERETVRGYDFMENKSRLDKEYARMFELSREIAENTVEIQMDMEEYLALKREYVKELRDMASRWSKEKNGQN